jgi:NhaP-type Na+/H+ or K+/H+ antiporter
LRDEIVVGTFAVVGFSIVVQGLTIPLLLRRTGIPLTKVSVDRQKAFAPALRRETIQCPDHKGIPMTAMAVAAIKTLAEAGA